MKNILESSKQDPDSGLVSQSLLLFVSESPSWHEAGPRWGRHRAGVRAASSPGRLDL